MRSRIVFLTVAFSTAAFASGALTACGVRDTSGRLAVTWELQGTDGAPVACLPGEEVHIIAGGYNYAFPCDALGATTGLVPTGNYTVSVALYTQDGNPPITLAQQASVFRNSTTDLGHLVFVVPTMPAVGSVTFTWALHQYSLDAPAEPCAQGESLYFEIAGIEPFSIDCSLYSSQPVTDLEPGRYDAYVALSFDGALEDDPRPGFGATEVSVSFDVQAGADTPVFLDFVVPAGPTRVADRQMLGGAPKIRARHAQK